MASSICGRFRADELNAMSQDPELRTHKEWLGYLQPVGLVVSPAALRDAQAFVNKNIIREQSILIRHILGESTATTQRGEEPKPRLKDFPVFAFDFWEWEPSDLAGGPGGPELPASLEIPLADYGEVLAPRYAVPDPANPGSWLMLIDVQTDSANLDEAPKEDSNDKHWHASPQARFERLLRANQVPIGLLINPEVIRIVYSPRGESTGHLTFPVKAMCEVAGRPIVAALHLLLEAGRLFSLPTNQRLPWILQQSRKYQNEVSTKLAEQVLRALNELMRGFQSANEATGGTLLADVLRESPQEVYGGLLTSLLRMVFILYAEDRGLLSNDPIYLNSYSLSGLFERLREDYAQYPDTMDQRFGGWAQFLALCRLIYDGGGHGAMSLPPRHGRLFDPDAYSFLDGRRFGSKRASNDSDKAVTPPRVSDGVIFRVLRDLIMLDGERLSYLSLDVEQIGSVYEAMMGFEVRTTPGTSIGLRPDHVVVNLSELLVKLPADRVKALKEDAGCELTGKALEQLKTAGTIEELVAAFGRRVSPLYLDERGMPLLVALGGIYLQPTEERRRSGSHYTPRSLTEPIVRTTLEPILKQLGEKPRPEQILDLKICDPAMGSGAFLVEACRFLSEALVESWSVHGATPLIPPDQEPILHARRLVAQGCLYGVDKNPFAVDLAKLSLWLATLAKDHAFTFVDHSLRHGDSLVGLSLRQIEALNWNAGSPILKGLGVRESLEKVACLRKGIREADESVSDCELRARWDEAQSELRKVRLFGDLVIAAFFEGEKPKDREAKRKEYVSAVVSGDAERYRGWIEEFRYAKHPLAPFHWEVEFPEVFERASPGFDAVFGNPPFLHGRRISVLLGASYLHFLVSFVPEGGGLSDIVAYFFRRAFSLIRQEGTMGLISTNTIAQGDTRATGLRWICNHGGTIYAATRRNRWPGLAAVVVSIVHVIRSSTFQEAVLDGRRVDHITAFLFHAGGNDDPARLLTAKHRCFQGQVVLGMGFTFDDDNPDATPLMVMRDLTAQSLACDQVIQPYIGGEETNSSPTLSPRRYVINFGQMTEDEARAYAPPLYEILAAKVRPQRLESKREQYKRLWWLFAERQPAMLLAIAGLERVITCSFVTAHLAFCFQPAGRVFAHSLAVFAFDKGAAFGILQSRVHELWARFLSGSMKDDLRYTPTDCFETFPFPENWEFDSTLEAASSACYEFRAALMIENDEGLTKTYNRFHDPHEGNSEIVKLRELHAAIDRSVLNAYGWNDIVSECEFLLDFEIDEEDWGNKKKPWRYGWPEAVRDEILARLLELNRQRAEEECLAGSAADNTKPKNRAPKTNSKVKETAATLFAAEDPSK